jgi:hypothetical protein
VFDDWDFGIEQNRVRRPRSVSDVVDIVRIDPNQCGTCIAQILRRRARQEWMIFKYWSVRQCFDQPV